MGSYISIGFVFNCDKNSLKESILKTILNDFDLNDYSMIIYKVFSSFDGKNCREKRVLFRDLNDSDYKTLIEQYYGSILFMCPFLDIKNQMINITVYQEDIYFGFLIDLFDDPFSKKRPYDEKEELLINYIEKFFESYRFDYAFCEYEGEIEYSPDEILTKDNCYSILLINENNKLKIKKGEYLIDGATKRKISD